MDGTVCRSPNFCSSSSFSFHFLFLINFLPFLHRRIVFLFDFAHEKFPTAASNNRKPRRENKHDGIFFVLLFENCLVQLHLCIFLAFHHGPLMLIPRLVTKDICILFAVGFVSSRNYSIPGTPRAMRIQPRRPPSQRGIICKHLEEAEKQQQHAKIKRKNGAKENEMNTRQNTQNLIHNSNFSLALTTLAPHSLA